MLMENSDRVGPLETFDLNKKLGHLHDLNDTHDLNVRSPKNISLETLFDDNFLIFGKFSAFLKFCDT